MDKRGARKRWIVSLLRFIHIHLRKKTTLGHVKLNGRHIQITSDVPTSIIDQMNSKRSLNH